MSSIKPFIAYTNLSSFYVCYLINHSMQKTLDKIILEEKIFLSTLIPGVDLKTNNKKEIQKEEIQKEELVSELTPAIIDLIIQQNLG